jgi:4'-phosphopantetheinyl transferase
MNMQCSHMQKPYDAWVFVHTKQDKDTPHLRITRNAELFLEQQGMYGVPIGKVNRTSKGKPYFADIPQVHLSISHSGTYWLCAFSLNPLGIDIQLHRACEESAIAQRFFHPCEADYLKDKDQAAFFKVWTAKESFVKYTGDGIDDAFRHFCVVGGDEVDGAACGVDFTFIDIDPQYTACVCRPKIGNIHLIHEQL